MKMILLLSFIIGAIYLVMAHRAHLYEALPYVVLGVFMLSHFFMHRGHGGHTDTKKGEHHGK